MGRSLHCFSLLLDSVAQLTRRYLELRQAQLAELDILERVACGIGLGWGEEACRASSTRDRADCLRNVPSFYH
jgi:hypothetical protein